MRRYDYCRLGLGTIVTALILLSFAAVLGTAALVFSNTNFRVFKTLLDQSYTTKISRNLESPVIENSVDHSSTQQLNFTFTNTGNSAINITKIEIDSPTLNVTGVTSTYITNAESKTSIPVYSKPLYSKITTETIPIPGSTILPGQTFTAGILYPCLTDPVTISATTSLGSVIKTQVAPNVGWYDSHWQFRKKLTLNYTQIVGNPNSIQLDNVQNTTGSGTSSYTLPNFVVGSGSNRLLLIDIESNTGTVQTNPTPQITYAGIPLTRSNGTTNTVDSEIWYLTNPPTGTADIAVTMTTTANVVIGAYSFFGVDQTYPISFSATNSSSTESRGGVNAYTTNPNSWVIDSIAVQNNPNLFTQNSVQTIGWSKGTSTVTGGSSYVLTSTPPITQKMGWSWSGTQKYADVAVEIKSSAFYNFPLLVNETTDTDLKQYAKSNRNDILFTACDGVTKLNHEIENYTTTTGSLTAWVQVPNIYNSPNNVIYMYYNNTAATNQQNVAGTWDPTFAGVWHFANAPPISLGKLPQIDNVRINATNATTNYQHILKNFAVGQHKDRLLLVTLSTDHPYNFTSVTYNGQSLTQIPHLLYNADSEFWYLLNPPVGSADIKAIRCTAPTYPLCTGGFPQMSIGAYSLYGVDQTTPTAPVAVINHGDSSTQPNVSVTNIFVNSLLIDQAAIGNGAQSGGNFFHPTWDLASPTQTQPNTNGSGSGTCTGTNPTGNPALNPTYTGKCPYVMDFTHDTSASSYVGVTTPCQTTTFHWTAIVADQWVDVAVEVKSNSSSGDTTVQDSTSHLNFLSPINLPACGQTLGKIGGGANLNGANQFFIKNTTLIGMPATNGPQTASIWYSAPSQGTYPRDLSSLQYDPAGGGTSTAIRTGFNTSSIDAWKFSPVKNIMTTPVPSLGNWHYAAYTYDRTTSRLFVDGVQLITSSTALPSATPNSLYIGASTSNNNANTLAQFLKGSIDEFRYSTTVRSASWIATEYNNQAFPSTFIKIGLPEKITDVRSSQ